VAEPTHYTEFAFFSKNSDEAFFSDNPHINCAQKILKK